MSDDRRVKPLDVAVIGASLTGLFAAAAAAAAGHRVTLLERDRLADAPVGRPGVPQGEQPHIFLLRGLLAADQLLPGLRAELELQGAVPFDTGRLAWLGEQGWAPVRSSGLEVISLTRPLFEQVVRRRVLDLDGVRLRDDCRVRELHRPESAGTGVSRWRVVCANGDEVDADLVVDASGRGSRLPTWLAALGVPAAAVSDIDARAGYATRQYRDGPDLAGLSGIVLQITPISPTGGLVLPVENGRWLVMALGTGDERPPRDIEGFEAFLHRLPDPAIADFADRSTPCGGVVVHRQTGNRRYHYENLRDWPDGLLAMGDAFVSFNPVFGQGITVGACQALLLRDTLAGGLRPGDSHRLMNRFAAIAAVPWSIAVGQDVRHPTCDGRQTRVQAVSNAWARELSRLGVHGNARAMSALARLYHLMASPVTLLHPALLGAALRVRISGYGPATQRPAALADMVDA